MNEPNEPGATENPFCSRRVRPGGMAYLSASGESAAHLVDRLRRSGWWGQVVGPHGSGKSALLAALVPAIESGGRRTLPVELHDGQRRLPLDLRRIADADRPTVLIVDGYEQLGSWHRFRAKRSCRRDGLGLLVTAHDSVGLPGLFQTSTSVELAQQIVEQLQRHHPRQIGSGEVAQRFVRHGGNLREMLFDLYDLYEQRRRETQRQRWHGRKS